MLTIKTKKTRQLILNEIVATLEYLDYLRYEALVPVRNLVEREERKKGRLISRLQHIEQGLD